MRITNKYNLPQPFVDFEAKHIHSAEGAEFSVTTLLSPPQIVHLERLHDDVLEEDVSDAILRLLGTAVHNVLEEASDDDDDGVFSEERFHTEIDGVEISGQLDRLVKLNQTAWGLEDYKVSSADTYIYNPNGKPEWEEQINVYAFLGRRAGYHISKGKIVLVIRDWKKSKAMYVKGYPERAVVTIPVTMWDDSETEKFLRERIRLHKMSPPPECTPEERWLGESKFAVHKYVSGGALAKRAARVLDSEAEAVEWFTDNSISGEIVERKAKPTRCEDWCGVAKHCNQYQKELGNVG
jgi:hypothetical protein